MKESEMLKRFICFVVGHDFGWATDLNARLCRRCLLLGPDRRKKNPVGWGQIQDHIAPRRRKTDNKL